MPGVANVFGAKDFELEQFVGRRACKPFVLFGRKGRQRVGRLLRDGNPAAAAGDDFPDFFEQNGRAEYIGLQYFFGRRLRRRHACRVDEHGDFAERTRKIDDAHNRLFRRCVGMRGDDVEACERKFFCFALRLFEIRIADDDFHRCADAPHNRPADLTDAQPQQNPFHQSEAPDAAKRRMSQKNGAQNAAAHSAKSMPDCYFSRQ